MTQITRDELIEIWTKGPYVNAYGVIVVPLHPSLRIQSISWEALGFHWGGFDYVRSIMAPYKGKRYGAQAWLTSTRRKFAETFPGWIDRPEHFRIDPPIRDPHAIARHLYDRHANIWDPWEAWSKGYPSHAVAGKIKNDYGIEDRAVRRELQRIAAEDWLEFDGMSDAEHERVAAVRNPIHAEIMAQVRATQGA
jgi:hypothetical protein